MKKLVFMFVAVAAISFASCGNKAEQAPAQDSVNVEDSALNDSTLNDSLKTDSTEVAE